MKYICTIISLLLISLTVNAGWPWSSNGIKAFQQNCLKNNDWKKITCEYATENKYRIQALRGPFTELSPSENNDVKLSAGKSIRERLIQVIKDKISDESLNSCQSAALVKCATSSYLSYDENLIPYFTEPLELTYYEKRGNCRQFSTLFDDLAKAVGMQSEIVSGFYDNNSMHAFNIIRLNKIWVYLEPQYADPKFFYISSKKFMKNWKTNSPNLYIFLSEVDNQNYNESEYMSATVLSTK